MSDRSGAELRQQLGHPVIDIDGHTVEFMPALAPVLKEEGVRLDGPSMMRRLPGTFGPPVDWYSLSPSERAARRVGRPPWGGGPSVLADDIATAYLPAMLAERLDEFGIDVSVIYPSYGLLFPHFDDERERRGACRALNRFNAEWFAPFADRLVPVAEIPMHTPDEAVDELEHAVSLGFRAVVMAGYVQRPVTDMSSDSPLADYAVWTDTYGLDSPYDYDAVWEKCREVRIAPTFHSAALGWQNRATPSSYVYNHIGMLGESNHALAKALFLGGVTRRFPDLNFAFLEGGIAWATALLADIIGHWEKRNGPAMLALNAPDIDWDAVRDHFTRYAPAWADAAPRGRPLPEADAAMVDEFAACGVQGVADIVDQFVPRFFAGCEADDPLTATAFDTKMNPLGSRLNAMFGSDLSHWDVPVMAEVLPEAYEMVEHGLLTTDDLRDFLFANPVRLYTGVNPDFFATTRVAEAVTAELSAAAAATGAGA